MPDKSGKSLGSWPECDIKPGLHNILFRQRLVKFGSYIWSYKLQATLCTKKFDTGDTIG